MQYEREDSGQFGLKGDEPRILRSMRLTDTCWEALGAVAQARKCSRSDLIEATVESGYYSEDREDEIKEAVAEVIAEIESIIDSLQPGEEPEIEIINHRDKAPAKRILRALIDHLS